MTLDEFRTENKLTYQELADGIGVKSSIAAWRYCKGERIPQPDVMPRIYDFTKGQVQPNDFYQVG